MTLLIMAILMMTYL